MSPRKSIQSRRLRRTILKLSAVGVVVVMLFASSLAPAGVEEQRQRLPPPATECLDPVTGVWLGHEILNGRWYRFELHIERTAEDAPELTGNIVSHSWDGTPDQVEPPPCNNHDHDQFILDMPAEGRFENNNISFVGQSWTLRENICGSVGAYYPDGFSGDLLHEGTEFHSLSDDGHNPVVPVVFRRIRCGDDKRPVPELPPLTSSPSLSSGCGGCF